MAPGLSDIGTIPEDLDGKPQRPTSRRALIIDALSESRRPADMFGMDSTVSYEFDLFGKEAVMADVVQIPRERAFLGCCPPFRRNGVLRPIVA